MSKLLDLLAQQEALATQIEKLKKDENEAKVIKVVDELESLRKKFDYEKTDFVNVVLSFYQVNFSSKKNRSSTKAEKRKQYKVNIDGVDLVLKESTRGIMKEDLAEAVKKAGFSKYSEFLEDLLKKNNADDFDELIDKLKGVLVE
ncbi:TPA: hypothetical protein ACRNDK_002653 [Pseudomonas aeruginosa]